LPKEMSVLKKPTEPIPHVRIKEHETKLLAVIDNDTGKINYYSKIGGKNKVIGGRWMATFQDAMGWLSRQKPPSEVLWVFLNMVEKLDYNNYIRISQTSMAKELGMKQPSVSQAIKKLIALDVIAEGPRAGLCKTYILNPKIGIKGRQKQQKIIDYAEKKRARQLEKANEASKDSESQIDE